VIRAPAVARHRDPGVLDEVNNDVVAFPGAFEGSLGLTHRLLSRALAGTCVVASAVIVSATEVAAPLSAPIPRQSVSDKRRYDAPSRRRHRRAGVLEIGPSSLVGQILIELPTQFRLSVEGDDLLRPLKLGSDLLPRGLTRGPQLEVPRAEPATCVDGKLSACPVVRFRTLDVVNRLNCVPPTRRFAPFASVSREWEVTGSRSQIRIEATSMVPR
jgi:hypothetical protein